MSGKVQLVQADWFLRQVTDSALQDRGIQTYGRADKAQLPERR